MNWTPETVANVLRAAAIASGERQGQLCPTRTGPRADSPRLCRNRTPLEAPACRRHLTGEEAEALQLHQQWASPTAARWLAHLPPACWLWPLPAGPIPLEQWQAGRCSICGEEFTGTRLTGRQRPLVWDHDHATGLVRGLLCHYCNKVESQDRAPDGRWANYRHRSPAALLGLHIRYTPHLPVPVN